MLIVTQEVIDAQQASASSIDYECYRGMVLFGEDSNNGAILAMPADYVAELIATYTDEELAIMNHRPEDIQFMRQLDILELVKGVAVCSSPSTPIDFQQELERCKTTKGLI